ncbi:MAG: ABC transporter substrate-binding protein [Pseudomonadota bacterium]
MTRRSVLRTTGLAVVMTLAASLVGGESDVQAADTIRIGELNSYSRFAAFTGPYRNGWQLALEEVNAAGGVLGKQIEIISKDDGGTTQDAVRVAEELVLRDEVDFIFGTFLSNIGLAVADFANQKKVLFIAAEPLTDALTMSKGNRYTFRTRPNTYMQTAMLVQEAKRTGKKRWAVVAPNYEYGQSAANNFKAMVAKEIPGAEVVVEQYPALGKIDAGATVQAMLGSNPDGIFSALFGGDLAKFIREGDNRGLFEDRTVVSLLTGEPEWLDILKSEAPEGWIVTGYPWQTLDTPEHKKFLAAYEARFDDHPRLGSVLGYTLIYLIKEAIEKGGSTETETMIEALRGITVDTPFGPTTIRAEDHQATQGAFVGKIALKNGKGVMVDWYYADGINYMPTIEEVKAVRPAE